MNVGNHYLENCIFTEINDMSSFWTSGRLFKNWTVYKSLFTDSSFTNFLSFYTSNDWSSTLSFINSTIQNLHVTFFIIEVCCTTFTLQGSYLKNIILDDELGKALLNLDDGLFYLRNLVLDNSGFMGFPLKNPTLWASLYRVLIAAWWSEIYLTQITILLSDQMGAPGGVFTSTFSPVAHFDDILVQVNIIKVHSLNEKKAIFL